METQRQEIARVVIAAGEPLTRPEIFDRCKLIDSEQQLSVSLGQMVAANMLCRAGERERDKGKSLALYAPGHIKPAPIKLTGKRGETKRAKKKVNALGGGKEKTTRKPKQRVLKPVKLKPSSPDLPPCEEFHCGIFNDGSFAISAQEGQITLQPGELAAMREFIDKISTLQ